MTELWLFCGAVHLLLYCKAVVLISQSSEKLTDFPSFLCVCVCHMQYYYSIWAGAGCSPRILFTVSAVQDLHEGFMGCFYGEVSQNGNSVWEYKQWGLVCEREGVWGVRGVGLWGTYLIIYLYNLQKKESVEAVGGALPPLSPPWERCRSRVVFF